MDGEPIRPHRIHHFQVALSRRTVELPWESRQPLIERLRPREGGVEVANRLLDVGTSSPARFTPEQKGVLLATVEGWLGEVGVDELPAGVWDLRCELQNELADGELEPQDGS